MGHQYPKIFKMKDHQIQTYEDFEIMLKKILDHLENVSGIMQKVSLGMKQISFDILGQDLRVNFFQE